MSQGFKDSIDVNFRSMLSLVDNGVLDFNRGRFFQVFSIAKKKGDSCVWDREDMYIDFLENPGKMELA